MGGIKILDGLGSGKECGIDSNNRLLAAAITENIANHVTEFGGRYNLNTGTINLTSANPSAVCYFKNNEDEVYTINSFIIYFGPSTGGSGVSTIDIYGDPTGGTVISNAVNADIVFNLDLGSARELDADFYKGAEGNTLTGGNLGISGYQGPSNPRVISVGQLLVPKGESIGCIITPPPGNTSMNIQFIISGYVNIAEATGGTL